MIRTIATTMRTTLPKATLGDTLDVGINVIVPVLAQGVIIRRPKVVAFAERFDLNRRAVRRVQRLRNKYGTGPLLLLTPPWWPYALIVAPEHVQRILNQTPESFATASREKRSALSHFEPKGALISHGAERADRRRFNEQVLDTHRSVHRLGERFGCVVNEEAAGLLERVRHRDQLVWNDFATSWFRVVRRVVAGDAARDDTELTTLINRLRSDANWAFFRPKRTALRQQFYDRLNAQLARAEPGSLASIMATTPTTPVTAPEQQVPQWLFAFDPAGMTTFRTLALLATHPTHAERVRDEIKQQADAAVPDLPYLRACVLESLRLWPTTPMVLRQSTEETAWENGVMPAQTGQIIFANFFHRDDQRLPYANRFAPELWLEERAADHWPLIPFSAGPAICPGQNLVLLVTSTMLAALVADRHVTLQRPTWLTETRPLPGTLSPYRLRFTLHS